MLRLPSPSKGSNHPNDDFVHAYWLGEYSVAAGTIGSGTFSKVKRAKHRPTNTVVAIKILNRDKIRRNKMEKKIHREIQNMKRLRHPHIVTLYEVIETDTDIFLVLEYVKGGELYEYIVQHGKFSESKARAYLQQIISAVAYCHSHNVAHRDLKPENLLLVGADKQTVKIADFGLSNTIPDGDFLSTSCGSPNYAAPEIINGQYYTGTESDIWSCGVILYALLWARMPFDDDYIPHLFNKIRAGLYVMPDFLSDDCKDLIKKMLIVDPLQRITIAEIKEHPWFVVDFPEYLNFSGADNVEEQKNKDIDARVVGELALFYDMPREDLVQKIMRGETEKEYAKYRVAYQIIYDQGGFSHTTQESSSKISQTLAELAGSPAFDMRTLPTRRHSEPIKHIKGSKPKLPRLQIPNITANGQKEWSLGVVCEGVAKSLMEIVLQKLKSSGFRWKPTGPYKLQCRTEIENRVLKIGIQLFGDHINGKRTKQAANGTYLLDLKIIEGEAMDFFAIGAPLFKELRDALETKE